MSDMTDMDFAPEANNPMEVEASTTEPLTDPTGSEPSDQLFEVKVDGQTKQVTLRELQDGYMMQSDYTRKTQEAANLRQEAEQGLLILEALSRNPREALEYMAEHYGVDFGRAPAQRGNALDYDDDYEDNPEAILNPKIQQLESEIQALKQQNALTTLDKEAALVRDKYGVSDEDITAAKRHMLLHDFPTVESAFKALHFDSAWEIKKQQAQRQAEDAKILAEKRDNLGVVSTQASPARGSVADHTPNEKLSVREAMAEALREMNLGMNDLVALD